MRKFKETILKRGGNLLVNKWKNLCIEGETYFFVTKGNIPDRWGNLLFYKRNHSWKKEQET